MYPIIGKSLGRFHHSVALKMAGIRPIRDTTGRWVYSPPYAAIMLVGLEEVDTYVLRHQNIVT